MEFKKGDHAHYKQNSSIRVSVVEADEDKQRYKIQFFDSGFCTWYSRKFFEGDFVKEDK